jgi:hypothetical protein
MKTNEMCLGISNPTGGRPIFINCLKIRKIISPINVLDLTGLNIDMMNDENIKIPNYKKSPEILLGMNNWDALQL